MAAQPNQPHPNFLRLLLKRVSSWQQSPHRALAPFSEQRINSQQDLLHMEEQQVQVETCPSPRLAECQQDHEDAASFQMPLHYPPFTRADYKSMPECQLDCLLREYGLPLYGDLPEKRQFAMGVFLWN